MDKAALASDVSLIFTLIFDGREADISAVNDDGRYDEEVRLARTLVYISRLISDHTEAFPLGSAAINFDAQDLIEAIAFGREHPVWMHLKQIQSKRRGPREISFTVEFDRSVVLLLLTLLKEDGCQDPLRATLDRLVGSSITKGMLRGWRDRSDERSGKIQRLVREQVEN